MNKRRIKRVLLILMSMILAISTSVILINAATENNATDTFYEYTFDSDLQGWVSDSGSFGYPAVEQCIDLGNGSLRINARITDDTQSWQELRISHDSLILDQANAISFDLYLDLSKIDMARYGGSKINPYVVLDPGWSKIGMGMYSGKISDLVVVPINGIDYAKLTVKNIMDGTGKTKIYLSCVFSNFKYTGPIYIDNVLIFKMPTGNAPLPDPLPRTDKQVISTYGMSLRDVNLVDKDATKTTSSLFTFLRGIGGKNILFGQQHATTSGLTTNGIIDGTQSDIFNDVGDFPALYGWDGLCIEGKEPPGNLNATPEENAQALALVAKKAYERGGIITLSSHMPNFVTGGDFYDTSGKVVSHILPGGDKNEQFNKYLDGIAYFAKLMKDSQGRAIPVIYRPFHENTGSWFWWGASYCSIDQYKNIYRYTVEYLRDKKNVHNFLYAYSPGSEFSSEEEFLIRYPGDDYVDVLGFDQYDDSPTKEQNAKWIQSVITRCTIMTKMAEERGKIPALTETGISGGVKMKNNINLTWYEDLLKAIKDSAKNGDNKIAYTLIWANFGFDQFWTPYRNHPLFGNNEMLQDFINFYNDDFTGFNKSLERVYDFHVRTENEKPYMYIVGPVTGDKITGATKVRAKVFAYDKHVRSVVLTTSIGSTKLCMEKDKDGYYSTVWNPTVEQNGQKLDLTVKVCYSDRTTGESSSNVKVYASIPLKTFTFRKDFPAFVYEGSYAPDGASVSGTITYNKTVGCGSVEVDSQFSDDGNSSNWTYQELKVKLPAVNTFVDMDIANKVKFDIMLPGSVSDSLFKPYVFLYKKDGSYQKYGEGFVQIKLKDFTQDSTPTATYGSLYRYTVSADLTDQATATDLVLAFVANDWNYNGSIFYDNLTFENVAYPPKPDPSVIDDFEGYDGSVSDLKAAYTSSGDPVDLSLSAHNGGYALRYNYSIGASSYCGIIKQMNDVDWSKFNALSFWLAPDGLSQRMVIQIKANGISFEAYPSLADSIEKTIVINFGDFKPAPWESHQEAVFTDNLGKINAAGIYVNQVNGYTGTSTLLLDDIKAVIKN